MKQCLTVSVSYLVAGIGSYYIFSGEVNFYSIVILLLGLSGILSDVFDKKWNKSFKKTVLLYPGLLKRFKLFKRIF